MADSVSMKLEPEYSFLLWIKHHIGDSKNVFGKSDIQAYTADSPGSDLMFFLY